MRVEIQQRLILISCLKYRPQLRLVGGKLGGTLLDTKFKRLVEATKIVLGFLRCGDVVCNADKADMISCRIPTGLRLRMHPAVLTVGAAVACFQTEEPPRSFSGDALLRNP